MRVDHGVVVWAQRLVCTGLALLLVAAASAAVVLPVTAQEPGTVTQASSLPASRAGAAPVPVILDTDIGDDIDDTWALAMLLGMPQLDLKLIVTDYGNTPERTP